MIEYYCKRLWEGVDYMYFKEKEDTSIDDEFKKNHR